jgi:PAS domain S-box-containing protein
MTEKANILLVDDQPAKLLAYDAILSELNENLIKASSGREALELLLHHEITVVLMDVNMPEIDGFELAAMIQGHPRFRDTAIIFVSAVHLSDLDRQRGYAAGAVDYVSVPVVPEILRAKVSVFIELHRKRRAWEHLNTELEERVTQRTAELEASNARLRASEERFRFLAEMVPSIVWAADPAGKLVYANRRWTEYCGPNSDEDLSSWPDSSLHPDDHDRVMEERRHCLASGQAFNIEGRIRRHDGLYRWFMTRAAPRCAESGEVIGWFGITTDIDNQIMMSNELREADRRKDEFLALLAHELRNPLAPLSNAVELMKLNPQTGADMAACRAIIERQVSQLARLVDDLLDVSRVTRGKITLRLQPLSLEDVVRAAIEGSAPLISERGHELETVLPEEQLWVKGDQLRLTQVVANLLNNAAKYQNEGGHIRLRLTREGDTAVISVTDQGIGIEKDKLSSVFELFAQVDTSIDRSHGGLGIGLSLVRSIVRLHGGEVCAYSAGLDKGSEFVVRLSHVSPPSSRPPQRRRRSGGKSEERRVLIVDDNADVATSLTMLLRAHGFAVSTAGDAGVGERSALAERPDVILLDIGMPGMNGYELCRRLRAGGLTDTMIVAVTGYGQARDRRMAVEAGFDAHVVKPVHLETLLDLLTRRFGASALPAVAG